MIWIKLTLTVRGSSGSTGQILLSRLVVDLDQRAVAVGAVFHPSSNCQPSAATSTEAVNAAPADVDTSGHRHLLPSGHRQGFPGALGGYPGRYPSPKPKANILKRRAKLDAAFHAMEGDFGARRRNCRHHLRSSQPV